MIYYCKEGHRLWAEDDDLLVKDPKCCKLWGISDLVREANELPLDVIPDDDMEALMDDSGTNIEEERNEPNIYE
jgi:hypothetical protein